MQSSGKLALEVQLPEPRRISQSRRHQQCLDAKVTHSLIQREELRDHKRRTRILVGGVYLGIPCTLSTPSAYLQCSTVPISFELQRLLFGTTRPVL